MRSAVMASGPGINSPSIIKKFFIVSHGGIL